MAHRCASGWLGDNFSVHIGYQDETTRKMHVVSGITVREEEKGVADDGAFTISREAAQFLLDQFIRAGLSPSNGVGSPAQVEAMKEHIKDLRRVAFETNNKRE